MLWDNYHSLWCFTVLCVYYTLFIALSLCQASEVTNVGNSTQTNTTKPLIITVKDVNDNPPKFGKDVYHGSVKENMTDVPISIPGGISVSDIDQVIGQSIY